MQKIGRNDKCYCKSGKKYKNCCITKDKELENTALIKSEKSLHEKMRDGELPFFSRIISTDGHVSSIQISEVSVSANGQTKKILDDQITLSTNSVKGDKTTESAASIVIPIIDSTKGKIETIGNAQVVNNNSPLGIEIDDKKGKMSFRSPNGLFASVKISTQTDLGFNYFTILFGVKGNKEFINESGRKNRSDVAIYPSGNGKFIRLSDKNGNFDSTWEITNEITYETDKKIMYPSKIALSSKEHKETLILDFSFQNGKVHLIGGAFK
jgi:hypothetical protein